MAADYDKLFRPHEGMEAPDDMAAQPFFDPSASFPPAPASANLPKPNGQTPPPTSDDLSERFVSAPPPPPPPSPPPPPTPMPIAAGEPPSPEPAASKPPTPPHAHRRTRTGPTQTTHTSDAHRRTCTHPNRIPVGAPQTTDTTNANRSAAATGITGAPRTLARATSTPAHRTSTALGKDANRRTPARSVQTVCVPGRTTDPACPPTLPTCAPGSPLSHRHRTKRREGSNWSIHPGAAARRGSIRRAARPRNGALASAVGPTEIVSGSAHPPRADRTSPSPSPQRNSGRRAERRVHPDLAAQHAAAQPDSITAATTGGRRRKRAAPDLDATQKSLRPAAKGPKVKKVKPQKPKATKPPKVVSQRGWRHWVHALTRINLGLSPDEKYELDLHARVRRNPRGSYQIAVVGLKGGAGKTTLTAALGSTLAQVRADRILALDADPGAGNLADRVGRQSGATIADVLAEKELSHYNDIRAHTSVNAVNLEVLPAPEYSSAQRALSDADWHFIADPASRFYNLVLADCGAGFFDPLTRGVLSTVSGVVVVASVSIDGAQQASVALDWLRNNGYQDLASRACVVINHIMPGEPNVAVKDLVRHFEQQVQPGRVVVMPWDRHIAAGTEISLDLLDPIYKRKVLELAAALSDDFERAGRR